MILSNIDIQNYVDNNQMIQSFDIECLKNSSYKIRIGSIIEPNSGIIIKEDNDGYVLNSNEVVIIESLESLKLPSNISVSYTSLYSISSKGILLINASMIEPAYEGKLSCFIVNFSSQKKIITKGECIARLTFYQVTQTPQPLYSEKISSIKYTNMLIKDSANYNRSFLDIDGIEKKINESTTKSVRTQIKFGGIIIFLLILFATIEPLISNFLWEKTGLVTNTEKHKLEMIAEDAIQEKKEAELKDSEYYLIQALTQKVDSLGKEIKKLKKKK